MTEGLVACCPARATSVEEQPLPSYRDHHREPDQRADKRGELPEQDSFVAAMTLGLAQGRSPEDAFAYGAAAGAAAVLTAGTGLCRREDVERLYLEIGNTRHSGQTLSAAGPPVDDLDRDQ